MSQEDASEDVPALPSSAAVDGRAEGASEHIMPPPPSRNLADASRPISNRPQALRSAPGPAPSPQAVPDYQPPDWGGVPEGVLYTLEVLKGGQIVEKHDVAHKGHYTFGRAPSCDFPLEHPTSSRLHAVLQYNQRTSGATVMDCGSTHGTFLNKARIESKVYTPMSVGDTLRFGQSSRLYILGGPSELMPAEGLSRLQKRQLAQLEYAKRMQEQDAELGRQQMAAAMSGGGVGWGLDAEDAVDEDALASGTVDWRSYAATHTLNDKMSKTADKIRQRELKVKNLRTECDRIRAKEKQENGLTAGQASTMARNEMAIAKLLEEIDELDDVLDDSVKDALSAKLKSTEEQHGTVVKRKKKSSSDDEYGSGSDTEDEFYDRTATGGATVGNARKRLKKLAGPTADVESAETLHSKREVLLEERRRLSVAIDEEQQRLSAASQSRQPPLESLPAEPSPSAAAAEVAAGVDSLDAYLMDLKSQTEQDKLSALRKELADADVQLVRCERLLKFVDPDGWYRPGSNAASSKAAAMHALDVERRRRVEALAAAAAKKAEQESAPFMPEVDEEDGGPCALGAANPATSPGAAASTVRSKPAIVIHSRPLVQPLPTAGDAKFGLIIPRAKGKAQLHSVPSARPAVDPARQAAAKAAAQLVVQDLNGRDPAALQAALSPGPTARPRTVDQHSAVEAAAAARVAADMLALSSARLGSQAQAAQLAAAETESVWVPPSGQTGDGRTSLNDRLGY